MNNRIKDKIKEIEIYIEQLSKIRPNSFKKYEEDFKTKAACERYFERIAGSIIDLATIIIKERGLSNPEGDSEAFKILENEGIINKDLTKKLREIRGMRNIIAHQYGDIDDQIMYTAIKNEIIEDVKEFLKIINKVNKK
jgi:uncharacterized protein YutE (UPF0331/DUF86 family)